MLALNVIHEEEGKGENLSREEAQSEDKTADNFLWNL